MIHLNGSSTRYNVAAFRPEVNTSTVQSYQSPLPARPRTLGSLLKIARINANLDQAEVAKRLGVNRVLISKWENDVHRPGPDNLNRLGELYGLSLEDLGSHEGSVRGTNVPRETVGVTAYAPNPALAQRVPPAAYRAVVGFLQRLAAAGLPHDRIDRYERLLLDDRWAGWRRDRNENPSDEEWVNRVEELWVVIREALAIQGIVP